MHYYQFNIADYRKDTQHLSPLEHYIYRELIDWYYLDETPIPKITNMVSRRLRLVYENNQTLLDVLQEFFTETDNGWVHARIEHEILAYKARVDTARVNGSKGGRPSKPKKTKSVISDNQDLTQIKPNQEPLTINQEPLTINQEPLTNKTSTSLSAKADPVPVSQIVELYHKMLPKLPKCQKITKARESAIKQRWREDLPALINWENYFHYIGQSPFLTGRVEPTNGRPAFIANLEWITKASNYTKILEGRYHGV